MSFLEASLYFIQIASLAIAVLAVIRIYFRKHSLLSVLLYGWLGAFLWALLNCMVVPFTFALFKVDVFRFCPEGPGVIGAAFLGWTLGIYIIVGILLVRLARFLFKKCFTRRST